MPQNLIRKAAGQDQMRYDPEGDAVHILNPTGPQVEELYRQELDELAIAQELRARCALQGRDADLEDVRGCLRDLAGRSLLQKG